MASIFSLHGFLGQPSDWDFLEGLSPSVQLHKVDVFKVAGHCNFEQWAQTFNEAALEQPEPRILMGYSMGGRLALHALTRNPSIWKAAILVSTHLGMPENEREARVESDERWAARFEKDDWEAVCQAWDSSPAFCGKPNPLKRPEENYHRADLAHALRAWSTGRQNDLLPRVIQLEMPILWVTGQEDRRYSEFSHHLRARLGPDLPKNWNFWEAPGVGHRVPWETTLQSNGAFKEHFSGFLHKVLLGEHYEPKTK